MKKFKKIILSVLCVVCVISFTPNTAMVQARDWDAIEKETQEAKKTNYWTKNGNKKYVVEKNYDMDKHTPDTMVKLLLADAKTQDAFGKVIFPKFKIKASSESDANKKIDAYLKKMKTASENKYGLGFGLGRKNPVANNYVKYDKKKKVATYHVEEYTTYEMYAMTKLFDDAMNQTWLEVYYTPEDIKGVSGHYYRQKTRTVFKNADAVKKASDSVKLEFFGSYMNGSARMMYSKNANFYDNSLKAVINKEAYGKCDELVEMWGRMAGLISDEIESRQYTCWRDKEGLSHTCLLLRAKNKDGNWDYFDTNNVGFAIFGNNFRESFEYEKGIDIYSWKNSSYSNIEDWMHYDKKAYVDGYGSFGKNAYKYGKAHKKSELVKLMETKKAIYR